MDDEPFWADVTNLAAHFAAAAPEGMEAFVEVETMDGSSFRTTVLQTQRTGGWLAAEIAPTDREGAREVLFVRQADVRRVHLRYAPKGKGPVGFRFGEIEP